MRAPGGGLVARDGSALSLHLRGSRGGPARSKTQRSCAGAGKSFSELTAALTALSARYRFILPSWMVFVVRAVVTLDGFAAKLDVPLSAVDEALPHAMRRALTPRTAAGRRTLKELCLRPGGGGEPRWEQLAIFSGESAPDGGEAAATAVGRRGPAQGGGKAVDGAGVAGSGSAQPSRAPEGEQAVATAERAARAQRPARALRPLGASSASGAKLGAACREALSLVSTPHAEGAALRRVVFELSLAAVVRRAALAAWQAHVRMWRPSIAGVRARRQVLAAAAAACAQLGAWARVLAARAMGVARANSVRTGAAESETVRRRRRQLLALLAHAQLVRLGGSPLGLLQLFVFPPGLLLLVLEASVLHCVAACARACTQLARLQAGRAGVPPVSIFGALLWQPLTHQRRAHGSLATS